MKTVVVMSCAHVKPEVPNDRFDWLGRFLYDLSPDEFINLGDFSDLDSLSSWDTRYPLKVSLRSYEADVRSTLDAHKRMWKPFKTYKKRMPYRIFLDGNHEARLDSYIQRNPESAGEKYGVSKLHFDTSKYYNTYIPYHNNSPGIYERDGILYSHFITSGSYGRAIEGVNHGLKLVEKMGSSVTVGHSHVFNYYKKQETWNGPTNGLSVGCFLGADQEWAGQANHQWTRGVVVKHGLSNGDYDLEWVSLDRLESEYG